MLRYWTSRYVITMIIGLVLVFIIFASWLRYSTIEGRLDFMNYLADDMINLVTHLETGPPTFVREEGKGFHEIYPEITLTDNMGNMLLPNRGEMRKPAFQVTQELIGKSEGTFKWLQPDTNEEFYVVKKVIQVSNEVVGYVYITEKTKQVTKVSQQFGTLSIFIILIALLGWLAIFFLSKRFVKPIKEMAAAAYTVQQGSYAITLPNEVKEKELYELIVSFRDMVDRLQQLEKTRSELLAGVTHELKTPVTSISSLLQAIQDGVVTGDEKREFLLMAIAESEKMKTMVGDLVNFNTFSVDAIPIKLEDIDINQFVKTTLRYWESSQQDLTIDVSLTELGTPLMIEFDRIRFQQIVSNLWNNARDAMDGKGELCISLEETANSILIHTTDGGPGIPEEEQPLIFERFFRGANKRYQTRGLGLGLSLSKMMALSMEGDLKLEKSDAQGSTFTIQLPKK